MLGSQILMQKYLNIVVILLSNTHISCMNSILLNLDTLDDMNITL